MGKTKNLKSLLSKNSCLIWGYLKTQKETPEGPVQVSSSCSISCVYHCEGNGMPREIEMLDVIKGGDRQSPECKALEFLENKK